MITELPSSWLMTDIRSFALDIQPGFARQPNETNEGCRQLRMPSISRSGFIDYTVSKFVDASDEEKAKYRVRKGDVIFNNTNSPELVGNAAAYEDEGDCVLSNHMTRIRVDERIVFPRYLAAVLHRYWRTGQTQRRAKQWINQAAIDIGTLSRFRIPLPPLSEQQRIVDILQEAEEIRRLRSQAEAKTAELIPAIYAGMFLTSKGRSDWKETTIGEIAANHDSAIRTGPFGSDLLHSEFVDSGTPVLGIDNVVSNRFGWDQRRYITPSKLADLQRFRVYPGDVMVTIMGTVGRVAMAPPDLPESISTKHLCVITPDKSKVLPTFLWTTLLHDPTVRGQTKAVGKGAIMEGWNSTIIRNLKFPLPPLKLQQRFDELVAEALALEGSESDASQAAALTASLSAHAFTGQLTEKWRGVNQKKLATEARERDIALGTVDRNVITLSIHARLTAIARATVLREALSYQQQQVLNVIEEHFVTNSPDELRWFTAEALTKHLGESVQTLRAHLAILIARSFVIAASQEQISRKDGSSEFGTLYRLPVGGGGSDEVDFVRAQQMSAVLQRLTRVTTA